MITRFSCPCHSGPRHGWHEQPTAAMLLDCRGHPPLTRGTCPMWVDYPTPASPAEEPAPPLGTGAADVVVIVAIGANSVPKNPRPAGRRIPLLPTRH